MNCPAFGRIGNLKFRTELCFLYSERYDLETQIVQKQFA